MSLNKKYPIILYISPIIVLLFIVFIGYSYITMRNGAMQLQFDGSVSSVTYSVKNEPTVVIRGKIYDLPVNFWDFDKQIQVGDSLIKHKNSLTVKIIKKDGSVIVKK